MCENVGEKLTKMLKFDRLCDRSCNSYSGCENLMHQVMKRLDERWRVDVDPDQIGK